jgi:hypothetical protein
LIITAKGFPLADEVLARMRRANTPIRYRVGTPNGRLSKLEHGFLSKPWAGPRGRPGQAPGAGGGTLCPGPQ